MSWSLDGTPLQSVLVSRLRYLGDVIMSTVVLEVLRAGDPQLRMGFLCEKGHDQVLARHPLVDQLHVLDVQRRGGDARARSKASSVNTNPARGTMGTVLQLRKQHYDLAVDLFFNPRSAWLLRLAGMKNRIGGTTGSRRRLYTHIVQRSEVVATHPGFEAIAPGGLGEHLCRLAPLVHQPSGLGFASWLEENFVPGSLSPRLAKQPLTPAGEAALSHLQVNPETGFIVLAPGATWPVKEWPLEHWRKYIQDLLLKTENSLLVLLPPGKDQQWRSLGQAIPQGRGGLLPVLGLPDAFGVISQSQQLVSVDGGIMHTGVGLGIPTLGLFGPTSTDIWFPYPNSGPFRVLSTHASCSPCNLHECENFVCLPDLEPSRVLAETLALLEAGTR